jgi:hypothetical protein
MHSTASTPAEESNEFLTLARLTEQAFAHEVGRMTPEHFRRLCTALHIHPTAPNAAWLLRNGCLQMLALWDRGLISAAALPKAA